MVQSTKPKTTHGEQLHRMLCFDYDRPYCLGKDLMAKHTLTYAEQFITTYSNLPNKNPWAVFLSFIDSHEDTSTLISYLDELLFDFIQNIDLSNTLVLVLSDHGMHYGPTFASNAIRERAEPILFMHFPEVLLDQTTQNILRSNIGRYVTAFDVHETIKDVSGIKTKDEEKKLGTSLLKLLEKGEICKETPGIPESHCEIINKELQGMKYNNKCTFMMDPPSIASFYADIPTKNRPSWPKCEQKELSVNSTNLECQCFHYSTINDEVMVVKCPHDDLLNMIDSPVYVMSCSDNSSPKVTINVKRKTSIVEKKYEQNIRRQSEYNQRPNIIILNIDSLSQKAADRSMPKTLSLLRSHQIEIDNDTLSCPSGFCAAIFDRVSIVGENSISNQLAALSGCTDRERHSNETYKLIEGINCPKGDIENPWLFDIVKDQGYLDFVG